MAKKPKTKAPKNSKLPKKDEEKVSELADKIVKDYGTTIKKLADT